ncbi:MAG: ABC transporter permease [Betaproteobacteria bacterium]
MKPQNWLPFEALVALRFLREGRIQTLFIVVGIAIGVAVIIFMSALLTGLQANFVNRVLTGQAHIQLLAAKNRVSPLGTTTDWPHDALEAATVQIPLQRAQGIDQWQSVMEQLQQMPEVKVVSPAVLGSALITRGEASRSVSVVGMLPQRYFRIIPLRDKMVQGSAEVGSDTILIGTELAADLGVALGDPLRVSTVNGTVLTLKVLGIFDLGNKGANSRNAFMAMRTAQSMFGLSGGASILDVTLTDIYAAERIAQQIQSHSGLQADSWMKTNEQFFTAVRAQTTANTAIRFFVGLSVGFGIASVLVVSVVQRSREIGILRAMGVRRVQIMRVFLLQGGLLGLGGALMGALIGALAMVVWQRVMRNADGSIMFAMVMDTALFVQSLVLASLTGLLSALAPALRAARLDPVVAIRT